MDTSNVPGTSASQSQNAQMPPMIDSVTLNTAYFAAQLEQQLQLQLQQQQQQQQQHRSQPQQNSPSSQELGGIGFPAQAFPSSIEHLTATLPTQLQSCIQQQQQQSARNHQQQQQPLNLLAPYNFPLARHFSAFSPIPTTDLNTPLGAGVQQPAQSLDLMLMQMQMATTAAAAAAAATTGMLPPPFNLLPPATALSLLCAPQFHTNQLNSSLSSSASTVPNNIVLDSNLAANAHSNDVTSALLRANLLQGHLFGSHTPATVHHTNETTKNCTNSAIAVRDDSTKTQNSPSLSTPRRQYKQSRTTQKRSHEEINILRSLCERNATTTATTTTAEEGRCNKKRLRTSMIATPAVDESNEQSNRITTISSQVKNALADSSTGNETSSKICEDSGSFSCDENSPHRHHPLNHSLPAMEARFLECMAAIALHSNISLPIEDNNGKDGDMNTKEEGKKSKDSGNGRDAMAISELCGTPENRDVQQEKQQQQQQQQKVDGTRSEDKNRSKRTWPQTAIDDELCKQFENYKDTDVPMIRAMVIPPPIRSPHSSSSSNDGHDSRSPVCSDSDDAAQSVQSLAVPVPVLDILLDRILQTMLEP